MCCVGHPVEPIDLAEDGHTGEDLGAGMEVVVWRDVRREDDPAALDSGESFADGGDLRVAVLAVLATVEDSGAVAAREGGCHAGEFRAGHATATAAGEVVDFGFGLDCNFLNDVSELGDVGEETLLGEGFDDLDDLREVVFAGEGDHVALTVGCWHEPESHPRDDAVVALAEDTVAIGPICCLEGLPGWVVGAIFAGHGSHAGSEEFSRR